ncbi:MAG: cbb3-type cytochrome c oxidase subunit I, partial [Pyrinomonadaceae bacterium]
MSNVVELENSHSTNTADDDSKNYLTNGFGLKSWLLTRDHKRIAILYMISITFMFLMGGVFALLIRLELLTPQADIFTGDSYNKLFTLHGVTMVWFF